MKITRVIKIVFSPTGGTQKVVDIISQVWKVPQTTIDISDPEIELNECVFTGHDLCIVAVPSFGGRVPEIAVERLKQIQALKSPTILVVTYGNRAYDDTLLELKDVLKSQGFSCVSAIAAVCQHSIMHSFAIGRPDKLDELQLTDFSQNIYDILTRVADMIEVEVPGHYPYVKHSAIPMHPKASHKCTNCGICAKKCPVQAIPLEDGSKTDNNKCITCMRCTVICPHQARSCNHFKIGIATKKLAKACSGSKPNELYMGE